MVSPWCLWGHWGLEEGGGDGDSGRRRPGHLNAQGEGRCRRIRAHPAVEGDRDLRSSRRLGPEPHQLHRTPGNRRTRGFIEELHRPRRHRRCSVAAGTDGFQSHVDLGADAHLQAPAAVAIAELDPGVVPAMGRLEDNQGGCHHREDECQRGEAAPCRASLPFGCQFPAGYLDD